MIKIIEVVDPHKTFKEREREDEAKAWRIFAKLVLFVGVMYLICPQLVPAVQQFATSRLASFRAHNLTGLTTSSQVAVEVPNLSADQARQNCLDRVQDVYGSSGSFDVGSVVRHAQEIQNCREGGAAPVDVVGDLYSRAEQIQSRGGYACNGIGIQMKQVLEAQGPLSPLIAKLLGRAQENGCL